MERNTETRRTELRRNRGEVNKSTMWKNIQNLEPEQAQQEPKRDKSLLCLENAEDEVIRHFEETEGTRKIIADLARGNNSDREKWIQTHTELTGLDDEQKEDGSKWHQTSG